LELIEFDHLLLPIWFNIVTLIAKGGMEEQDAVLDSEKL
jgi:hypothetical protein